ncbi:uncharacterized protein LOC135848395 [Planococcus citri]|uniref:uncharacterized protein LOC135848395 n=1 Tax=Planococcus citri TaxID=170843 RepID=UPI0031F83CFE
MTGSLTAWKNKDLCSVLTNCFTVKDVDLLLDNTEHMKFLWIPLFKVWYPVGHYEFRKIVYEIHRNNIDATLQCEDYSLGQELFEFHQHTKTGHPLYSKDHQMVVLGGVKLPPPEAEGACEPEYECLMKWQLIPADQFQFGYSESLSCSNLTTVPLWRSTLEGIMKKLDHYLYTLSRVSGKPLRITAGMAGVLQLQNDSWIWGSNRDIYLNEDTKLRVPKIIYKVVKFESNQCKGDAKSCWYGIVIVIHNGPYFVEKSRICEQDKSGELGWEEIRYETWSYEGPQSKFIYVCSISAGIFSKLGLTFKKDVPVQDLSLLRFPYLDENNQPSWKNMKKEVFRELDRLSKTDEKLRLDDNEIIERPSIDSDKYVKSQEKSTNTNSISNDNGGDIENDRQKTE